MPNRLPLLLLLVAGLTTAGPAQAGTWFDLGAAHSDTLTAEQDMSSREIFPPNAFGVFPRGSWVWQEINVSSCDQLRWPGQVCSNGGFVRGFRIEFNDGGCGCGGYVQQPATLRLTYDPQVVTDLAVEERSLRVVFNYNPPSSLYNIPGSRAWLPAPRATLNLADHCFDVVVAGDILGIREYAIVTDAFVSVRPMTWSRIKTLYER